MIQRPPYDGLFYHWNQCYVKNGLDNELHQMAYDLVWFPVHVIDDGDLDHGVSPGLLLQAGPACGHHDLGGQGGIVDLHAEFE